LRGARRTVCYDKKRWRSEADHDDHASCIMPDPINGL
jgi:hypothetical protein